MATAKPKTTKIEAPIEEALQGLSDVLQEEVVIAEAVEEALVEEPVVEPIVEEAIEELPVEEPVVVEAIVEAPQSSVEAVTSQTLPLPNQPIWYGAMTSQIHKQRNQ
jgi:hypothetical protein